MRNEFDNLAQFLRIIGKPPFNSESRIRWRIQLQNRCNDTDADKCKTDPNGFFIFYSLDFLSEGRGEPITPEIFTAKCQPHRDSEHQRVNTRVRK